MKVIIAGGRDTHITFKDIESQIRISDYNVTEIVEGGSSGVDTTAYKYAKYNKIPVKEFYAEWDVYGKCAGPIRNRQMAEYADALIAFPGGKGTQDMINAMRKLKKPICFVVKT